MAPKSKITRYLSGLSKPRPYKEITTVPRPSTRRVWLILSLFLAIIGLIIASVIALLRMSTPSPEVTNFNSQPLSNEVQTSLRVTPLTPEDYLVGGNLDIAGALGVNRIISSADMLLGSAQYAVRLQGSDVSLVATNGGITNTLRFAAPSGTSKTILMPNASGTVAVSASGPLLLDVNGNLSCPSCTAQSSDTTIMTLITNNFTTNTINMVSLAPGNGIAITEQGGTSIIAVTGMANQSLSNLSGVAINTSLLPGTNNSIDVGSGTATFRSGYFGTSVRSAVFDTVSAGQLNIGTSVATNIVLGANTSTATGKTLTVNGAAVFKNNVNSTTAFQVQDSAGTALLNANTSQGTLSVGTYVPTVVWLTAPVTKTDYVTGANPQGVTKADVNGDGWVDLMTSNISSDTVSVFMNNGNGTFAAKVDYATGLNPRGLISADFNGDARPDLAVANWGANTISVLLNNGNGTFATKVDYATGSRPQNPTSADFNGDGIFDLVVAHNNINVMSVFMNNGNGTFAAKVDYTTGVAGTTSWAVTAADFNGDARADIAVTNTTVDTMAVFINNGNGTFANRVDYTTGSTAYGITAADFNGDARPDLAVTNINSNTVSTYSNNGNGTFAAKVDYVTSNSPNAITAVDLNNDTKVDLAVVNNASNTVSTFLGNGMGVFAPKTDYNTGGGPTAIAAADFNGDGTVDLATANNSGSNMSVLLFGITTGTPVAQTTSKLVVNTVANTVGQIIQGTAGQTADLLQVRNDLNGTLFNISSAGSVTVADALTVAGTFTNNGSALFKNSLDSQTAFQVQQTSGTSVFSVDTAAGRVGIGTNAPGSKLSINTLATVDNTPQLAISTGANNNKGLLIQGVSGQTADLLQAKSSTGVVLASIGATGTLTVTSAVVSGTLTVNGHIITGGTAPTIVANAVACTTPTVSVVGNDTSGKVTITTGTGCVATGVLATVTFNSAFGTAPRVILTPSNAPATNIRWFNGVATTTTFTIDTATVPTDATQYVFTYWTAQ